MSVNPDETLDTDGGDTAQKRFHYQAAYAAIEAIRIMNEKLMYDSVYCEQIEDVLVKLKTGKFVGIQVKTQLDENGPFTFNHEYVIKALKRFLEHESRFSDKFQRYILCTNCGFTKSKNASNLPYCLDILRKYDSLKASYENLNFSKSIDKICEKNDYEESLITNALKKTETLTWASLNEYERLLPMDIKDIMNLTNEPFSIIEEVARQLIELTSIAARLPRPSADPSYYEWLLDPEKAVQGSIIQNKRITKEKVEAVLNRCLTKQTIPLQGLSPFTLSTLPQSMNTLELKMEKGGISQDGINIVKDFDNSAFLLLKGWGYRYKKEDLDARIEYLRLLVQHECQYIYNKKINSQEPFGAEMLTSVRDRLVERQSEVMQKFPECSFEILEGIAGMLTQKCSVWWSKKFDVGSAP